MTKRWIAFGLISLCALAVSAAYADEANNVPDTSASDQPSWYSLHLQGTAIEQGHPAFPSAIPDGLQSMKARAETDETTDMTLFAGAKIDNLELYADPEMDQGYGLSDTFGLAGFSNGEGAKVGQHLPYFRLPRMFGRYVFDLGGDAQKIDDDLNQVAGRHTADNVILTFGKFSVVDIFDNNAYAHDPRGDFLNWSIIDMGAFDYAADAWGYTYGGAVEWTQDWWTLRGGLFDMSRQPNDKYLVRGFGQNQLVLEAEDRYEIAGNPGKLRALFFGSSADMGSYADAVALGTATGAVPNTALVRHYKFRPGGGLNAEQQILPDLGAFARASLNDGSKETYEYTEINRSLSGGLSLKGDHWNRPDDTVGLGGALNGISSEARHYFASGGLGILIGDGQLPSYAAEKIVEAYYKATLVPGVALTADYQRAVNPAYDAVRGPIDIYAVRLHLEY